jgi:hypothetical protein
MKLLITCLIVLIFQPGFGQEDSVLQSKIAELKAMFHNYSYSPMEFKDTSLEVIRQISTIKSSTHFPDRSIYLQKRAEQLRTDLGVDFTGNYVENFNVDPLEDIEDNIAYQRRVQTGLRWDVLDGGYFENKVMAQMMEDRILREKLSNDVAKESQYFLARFDQTVYSFNNIKMRLLGLRLIGLRKQFKLIRDLVILKKLRREQLIQVEIKLHIFRKCIT